MISKPFPPPRLQDLSRRSASNLLSLARKICEQPCTLVAGAGVSTSAGFPTWKKLLKNIASIYFTHWRFSCEHESQSTIVPPKNISIAFWESFMWDVQSQHLADKLIKIHDPLTVAQMILSRVAKDNQQYLIRKALYGDESSIKPSPLMKAISDLCTAQNITAVMSYNYDDLLEQALKKRSVSLSPIWGASMIPHKGSMPLYYPHGYLKQDGGPVVPIVLAEDDYLSYSTESYDWRNLLQLGLFSTSCCLFVGFSMNDPQIRRLLWIAKRGGAGPHYSFLSSKGTEDEEVEMLESLVDTQLNDFGVRVIRYPLTSTGDRHGRLLSLIKEINKTTTIQEVFGLNDTWRLDFEISSTDHRFMKAIKLLDNSKIFALSILSK